MTAANLFMMVVTPIMGMPAGLLLAIGDDPAFSELFQGSQAEKEPFYTVRSEINCCYRIVPLILELCHSAHPMLVMDYPVADLQLFYTEGMTLGRIPCMRAGCRVPGPRCRNP